MPKVTSQLYNPFMPFKGHTARERETKKEREGEGKYYENIPSFETNAARDAAAS